MEWEHYLSWDLGPLKPWEYWQMDAFEWTLAHDIKRAWKQGLDDARDEYQAKQDLAAAMRG